MTGKSNHLEASLTALHNWSRRSLLGSILLDRARERSGNTKVVRLAGGKPREGESVH